MTESIPQFHLFYDTGDGEIYKASYHDLEATFAACMNDNGKVDTSYFVRLATATGLETIALVEDRVFRDDAYDKLYGWKFPNGTTRDLRRDTIPFPKPISAVQDDIRGFLKAAGIEDITFSEMKTSRWSDGYFTVTMRVGTVEQRRDVHIHYLETGLDLHEHFDSAIRYLHMTPEQRQAWEAARPKVTGAF
jgi:hypothetical protein